MKRKWFEGFWIVALFFAMPAAAVMLSHGRLAAEEEPQGRIVDITDGNSKQVQAEAEEEAETEEIVVEKEPAKEQAAPRYWIGLQGGPIDSKVLRTQFQLADDVGVVVQHVVPDSPADKAGLQRHDIIVAVNGEPICGMEALQEAVVASETKPLKLKVIRLAEETTVEVTPAERPKDAPAFSPMTPQEALRGNFVDLQGLLEQLQKGDIPGGWQVFGPGVISRGGVNFDKLPAGVSVSITRKAGEPPTITVKKDDQTWIVKGDDEEALKELPEDVRPFVEQMLAGGQPGFSGIQRFNFGDWQFQGVLPDQLGRFDAEGAGKRMNEANERLRRQMERMERRLKELEKRLQRSAGEESAEITEPAAT